MSSPVIGIDLGTTYSCVGIFQHGKVEIIANDQGSRLTPSCVAFTDKECLIGEVAKSQALRDPENAVFEAKRLMGRRFDDPKVQDDMKNWPFRVMNDSGRPKVQVEYKGETKRFTAQEISAMVLSKMKATAEAYLGTAVKDAVVTVPAYFNNSQRQATKDAATIAGLSVKRIINEPTAAALAYGLHKKMEGERNVLTFDLGGGTFDVSILTISAGSTFKVLSTAGDTHLGGEDFTNMIVKHFVNEFQRKYQKDVSSSPKIMRKLKVACEQAKIALSSSTEANVEIDSLNQGIHFQGKISRARFEALCMDLFRNTLETVKGALRKTHLKTSDIHEVILVGGSTRIPRIQTLVKNYFQGKELKMDINADEAVAHGAALQAAILSGDFSNLLKDVVLIDVVPLSLGTDINEGRDMKTIIERNTSIPVTKSETFSTVRDYQTAVHVGVYQGERPLIKDNHMLAEFTYGLRPAPKHQVILIVEFDINEDGILSVSAKEKQTGNSMQMTVTNDCSRLGQQEIERMLREAEQFATEDNAHREVTAAMQELERYIYLARDSIDEAEGVLTESEKHKLRQRSDKAIEWMDATTLPEKDEVVKQLKGLQEEFEPILAKIR